ncbi:N-formylglutamate amidohydrolase [Mariprofundus sp. NF]|uniref:N-formylglutamate amidohydrolase n=1 Tax=Mariprofundus sp. NF TaxID=2608716 RepID=UPI00159FDD35|nr:N-formylglutamate amidohydrolase [Mariprofundus sp. NF]NWF38282.1 N-formylglutamate amidohydrolase [Mariprofundus sp. NF]
MSFTLITAGNPTPFIASIPHAGLLVPEGLPDLSKLPNHDWHIDKLYDFLPSIGVTTLKANYSRYVVDLNRSLAGSIYGDFYTSCIAETDSHGNKIYDEPPADLQSRIRKYYDPYHQRLNELISETVNQFGFAVLMDIHSFAGGVDADIELGNANGMTCIPEIIDMFHGAFSKYFEVAVNEKYVGGQIIRKHCSDEVQTIQIEHCYNIYLDDDLSPECEKFSVTQEHIKNELLDIMRMVG